MLQIMQLHDLLLDNWHEFFGEFHGPLVIGVSFVIPHVPLKLILCVFSLCFLFRESVVFLFGLIEVAFIVASCSATMLLPLAQADPTEVPLALDTLHMVTAMVLFDVLFALGACFCVG